MYTTDYFSTIKKNEMRPSAATCMGLERVTLSEVSQQRRGNVL